jgi:hypothetical protein
MASHLIVDGFGSKAMLLRRRFEEVMADPEAPRSPERFSWDWWHVPGRYTHLRTPAARFFSKELIEGFRSELQAWGRSELGCGEISPIWLSLYVEGCEQNWHADHPHGPWAFVYSLTPKSNAFRGGETQLLRPEVLSRWSFTAQGEFHADAIIEKIAPKFSRLIAFDPRIPHGVTRVEGTRDPLVGRLVLHGWFTPPQIHIDGPLKPQQIRDFLKQLDVEIFHLLQGDSASNSKVRIWSSSGHAAFRLRVLASGKIQSFETLADSLRAPTPEQEVRDRKQLVTVMKKLVNRVRFPTRPRGSTITLPLSFE